MKEKILKQSVNDYDIRLTKSLVEMDVSGLPYVGDSHIYQLFQNLIGNAFKFRRQRNLLLRLHGTRSI